MSKPKALFIFGGTGDLARKKLFPALAKIVKRRDDLKIVYSIARSKREDWEGIACNLDAGFTKLCHFIPLDKVCTSIAPDGTQRVPLSYQYLNSSCVVVFALKGEEKRKVYEKLLKGEDIPASKVKGKRKTFIIYST